MIGTPSILVDCDSEGCKSMTIITLRKGRGSNEWNDGHILSELRHLGWVMIREIDGTITTHCSLCAEVVIPTREELNVR